MPINIIVTEVLPVENTSSHSITIEATLPQYVWSFLRYGTIALEEDIYKKVISKDFEAKDFSSNSMSLLYKYSNEMLNSLVSFYMDPREIPVDTLMSIISPSYLQTKVIKYSVFDFYLTYKALQGSILEDAKIAIKLIETHPEFKNIIEGNLWQGITKI